MVRLARTVNTASAAEEAAKELQVLKVCLAEIERSRPFLIGLIGDRYGWVPPTERMQAAAKEAGFTEDVKGIAVFSRCPNQVTLGPENISKLVAREPEKLGRIPRFRLDA